MTWPNVTDILIPIDAVCQECIPQSEWAKFVSPELVDKYNAFNQPYRPFSRFCQDCDSELVACRHERSGGLCRERYVDGMGYGKNAMKFNRRTFPFFPIADSRLFVNWLIMPLICALRHACQPQLRLLRCCQGSNEIGKVVIRIEMVAYETCTTMSPQHCWLASTRVTNIRAQCAPILIKYEPLNSLRKFLFCLCLWKSSPITGRVCNLHTLHISLTLHGKKAKWTWIWQTGLFYLRPVPFFF